MEVTNLEYKDGGNMSKISDLMHIIKLTVYFFFVSTNRSTSVEKMTMINT